MCVSDPFETSLIRRNHSEPSYLLKSIQGGLILAFHTASVRYIQCTVVTAFPGRSKVALLLFARHPRRTAVLVILSLQNCSLLAHIFRLIIVALGYLAGALGDCSGRVSRVLLFLKSATPSLGPCILLSSPAVRCPGVVALTRVCERDLQSVVVAEAFADRRDDGLCRSFCSAFDPVVFLLQLPMSQI